MKKVILFLSLIVAILAGVRLATGPKELFAERGSSQAGVQITARVDTFAEWAEPAPIVFEADWPGPINRVNQQRTTTRQVVLYTNTDVVITPKPELNHGVLTQGSSSLETAYKLTGAVMGDDRFKLAREFFNPHNSYRLTHIPGTGAYTIQLQMQITSPSNAAPEEGTYTCSMTLTATW